MQDIILNMTLCDYCCGLNTKQAMPARLMHYEILRWLLSMSWCGEISTFIIQWHLLEKHR